MYIGLSIGKIRKENIVGIFKGYKTVNGIKKVKKMFRTVEIPATERALAYRMLLSIPINLEGIESTVIEISEEDYDILHGILN